MKNLKEYLIGEKLGYTNKVTLKICKAFGFTENDEWGDVIDKWVTDNDVQDVQMYTENINALKGLHMPNSIIKMYKSGNNFLKDLNKRIHDNGEKLKGDEWFMIRANEEALYFASSGEDCTLYAVKI